MPTYNPNDFYPRSGAEIQSNGNVVNEADGINSDGSENVVLTGRNVQEILVVSGLAITDAVNHDYILNVTTYGKKAIMVYNTLNQPVVLSPIIYNSSQTAGAGLTAQTMSTGGGYYYSAATSGLSALDEPIYYLKIRLSCTTPPTAGAISVWLEAVPN